MTPRKKEPSITSAQLNQHEMLVALFNSMHDDIRALTLKNQNAALSKARITLVNRLLADLRELLRNEPTVAYLQVLDEAIVPQNADVLLILGQFKAALQQFHDKYTYYEEEVEETVWRIAD